MLTITIPGAELFDEANQVFIDISPVQIDLEHSLLSVSKWESKVKKPFLGEGKKTPEEILVYVEAMILTPGITPETLLRLSDTNLDSINAYIDSTESATTFHQPQTKKGRPETITSELIYFWMVNFRIPFECQTWHLNRLFSLIRICGIKNSKPTKMSKAEAAAQRRELNAQRRAKTGSSG